MYSTCIFCHTSLGANEAIEHFPVGRRLAFDAAKGRLWVVCKACERWNLSPIDERWEAIEECEKLFRDSRLRVSTDNIGLAKLKEGSKLIRIGKPQRPEMAAWRYGDQFRRRRLKNFGILAATVAAYGGVTVAGHAIVAVGVAGSMAGGFIQGKLMFRTLGRASVRGKLIMLNGFNLAQVAIRPNDAQGFVLEVPSMHWISPRPADRRWYDPRGRVVVASPPVETLHGAEAIDAARQLLPLVNRRAGSARELGEAIILLESARNPDFLFSWNAMWGEFKPSLFQRYVRDFGSRGGSGGGQLGALPPHVRLALEMSLHEEDERRALEGELGLLEDRWREAEEIAAISDDMFLPSRVSAMLNRLKGDRV